MQSTGQVETGRAETRPSTPSSENHLTPSRIDPNLSPPNRNASITEEERTAGLRQAHLNMIKIIRNPPPGVRRPEGCPEGPLPMAIEKLGGEAFLSCADLLDQTHFGVLAQYPRTQFTHPIYAWDSERFPNITQDVWEVKMADAVWLASQMLETRQAIAFFARVIWAGLEVMNFDVVYLQDLELTEKVMIKTRNTLHQMAPFIEFCFTDTGSRVAGVSTTFERSRLVPDDASGLFPHLRGHPLRIGLNCDFYRHLTGFTNIPGASGNDMLERRVQFVLATTLLQAVAHACFRLQRVKANTDEASFSSFLLPVIPPHPIFSPMSQLKEPDWGFELELALFDRIIMPTVGEGVIPYYGLFAEKGKTFNKSNQDNKGRYFQCVPMIWVEQWFNDEAMRRYDEHGLSAMRKMTDLWISKEHWKIYPSDPQLDDGSVDLLS
jgi:hypothetical protein